MTGENAPVDPTAAAYETFQYENLPFRMSHPDWMRTLGVLAGLQPAPIEACRVLEIGCAHGGHLLPLAELLPGSEFVGFDLAASQIDGARRDAEAIGLTNVRFEACDVRDVSFESGPFDYVICHGVYSWVPDDARRAILDLCAATLAPHGLAYVSYNTYPGWHARGMLRSMLRRAIAVDEPAAMAAAARTFLAMLKNFAPDNVTLQPWLLSEIELLDRFSDRYLYFEHLVEENTPFWFADFVSDARAAGLVYVAEAEVPNAPPTSLGGDETKQADAGDHSAAHIESQQLLDMVSLRHFRRSLLARADSGHRPRFVPEASAVERLWVTVDRTRMSDDGTDTVEVDIDVDEGFEVTLDDDGQFVVTSGDTVPIVAMWTLARAERRGAWFADLLAAVDSHLGDDAGTGLRDRLAAWAIEGFLEGRIQLSTWPRPVAHDLPERPRTTRLARWQAMDGRSSVTNIRHEALEIDDLDRVLIAALDGESTVDELVAVGTACTADGQVQVEVDGESVTEPELLADLVRTKLDRLVRRGLVFG